MPRPLEPLLAVLRALTLPKLMSLSQNVADLAFEDATHMVSTVPQQEGGYAALGINAMCLEVFKSELSTPILGAQVIRREDKSTAFP